MISASSSPKLACSKGRSLIAMYVLLTLFLNLLTILVMYIAYKIQYLWWRTLSTVRFRVNNGQTKNLDARGQIDDEARLQRIHIAPGTVVNVKQSLIKKSVRVLLVI